ncbi:MAG: aminoacyl-tRNA hydrolase [Deferribacteres bacterium]|nr:aminoacyl-tRNA hydrolase [Deferribacteres bacterium]
MWLVAGLGNPGDDYAKTRHNIGFMVIDAVAARSSITVKQKTANYIFGRGFIGEQEAILIKPLTFMNRSGIAVKDAAKRYDTDGILVVHDDIDLPAGVVRIRKSGSSGGHNGIESIINALGTRDFIRVKVGIGRSDRIPPEQYVLRPFNRQELEVMEEAVEKAAEAVTVVLNKGVSYAQNIFHRQ